MKSDFFKFPSTPHLIAPDIMKVRSDKVMSPQEKDEFLENTLIIEEKIDGANLGISFDKDKNILAQNRGAYINLPAQGQWKKLSEWLSPKIPSLCEHLTDHYILFGEWCYAQHSIFYEQLPDWFLGFDIYDKQEQKFLSYERRNDLFNKMQIYKVPTIEIGKFNLTQLKNLLSQSKYSKQPAEGLYLRFDQNDWLECRAKFVRTDFIQAIKEHWSHKSIKVNQLTHY